MMSMGMASAASLEASAANHSSNPAMRPASPPARFDDGKAERRARARRSADAGRTSDSARHAARVASSASAHRLSRPSLEVIVTAWMRPSRNASASPAAPLCGPRAAIAGDVVDVRAARAQRVAQVLAAAVAAKDQDPLAARVGELRQREQALAVEGRRRNARAGDARPRPAPRRSRARARRRRAAPASGARSGAPYSTALAETKIAKSYVGQRRVRAGERRGVGRAAGSRSPGR